MGFLLQSRDSGGKFWPRGAHFLEVSVRRHMPEMWAVGRPWVTAIHTRSTGIPHYIPNSRKVEVYLDPVSF